jgi:uncharacterized membrane protein YedE/YeeE
MIKLEKKYPSALVAGILFGVGLAVSEMINPRKILAFLDLAGAWDPSLLFVLGGAVLTTFTGYRWVLRRREPLFESRFRLPATQAIDYRLILGAAIFGVGWGLVGYCPGPAIATLVIDPLTGLLFVATMLLGAWSAARFGCESSIRQRGRL